MSAKVTYDCGATAADLLDEIPHSDAGFETTGPHESRKELADRLIRRLKVKDLNAIYEMISSKAYLGGILIAILILFHWIFISSTNDNLDLGHSILMNFDFQEARVNCDGLRFVLCSVS